MNMNWMNWANAECPVFFHHDHLIRVDSGSRAHVRVSDAASLPSPRNAAGPGRSENPSNSPRAAQKECRIYYVLP